MDTHRHTPPRVVMVGAGFGGLQAARGLAHAPVWVTLIDRHNYHLFQPLLYQVATARLSPAEIGEPIYHLVKQHDNTEVLLAEVIGIDVPGQQVLLPDRAIPYDILALAPGTAPTYFGRDSWRSLTPGLKAGKDAITIRYRLLLTFEQAEMEEDPVKQQAWLTFVIVGGGPGAWNWLAS